MEQKRNELLIFDNFSVTSMVFLSLRSMFF